MRGWAIEGRKYVHFRLETIYHKKSVSAVTEIRCFEEKSKFLGLS